MKGIDIGAFHFDYPVFLAPMAGVTDTAYRIIAHDMGCPAPKVVKNGEGSALMKDPERAYAIMKAVRKAVKMPFTVKMRLGWDESYHWREIIPLFDILKPNQVVVHPRTGRQQYKGVLNLDEFASLLDCCPFPVVYNGELKSLEEIDRIVKIFPDISGLMIGRGLIEDPAMLCPEKGTADNYCELHNRLRDAYSEQLNGGEHQLLLKMKSLWEMFLPNAPHKSLKAIKKSTSMAKYNIAVNELFYSL